MDEGVRAVDPGAEPSPRLATAAGWEPALPGNDLRVAMLAPGEAHPPQPPRPTEVGGPRERQLRVGGMRVELLTSGNLLAIARVSRNASLVQALRNCGIVYVGDFVASALMACLIFLTSQCAADDDQVRLTALKIADAKCGLPFLDALMRGIPCNALVCLAVWPTFSCR